VLAALLRTPGSSETVLLRSVRAALETTFPSAGYRSRTVPAALQTLVREWQSSDSTTPTSRAGAITLLATSLMEAVRSLSDTELAALQQEDGEH
jgi:hypothetical protein